MSHNIILADPPWSYGSWQSKNSRTAHGTADTHYPTMTTDEICAMRPQVDEWAARDCALFMWVTAPLLADGMRVMDAWGFNYKTFGLVWMKTTTNPVITYNQTAAMSWERARQKLKRLPAIITGSGDIHTTHIGMGYYSRSNVEIALLGIRGKMKPERRDISQVIIAPVRDHSQKPDEQYDRIEAMYPEASKIELFARRRREGWNAWGNQVPEKEAA
ncbi:MAG: MT-A70 family methyltransferase [Gammaproteobacteria bacterium]|nr:MT-A70 family methyltransferase [Gammaproteobacteria bacterium]